MARVTARDVARAAGVSLSAVSRAFRPDRPLAEAKRARILAAARALGYDSPYAQAISTLATGTIALVAGDFENPFYPKAAHVLSQAIHRTGRRMILHVVPPDGDVDTVLEQVLAYRADAAIVTSSLMSSRIARGCRDQNLPVILFNRVQPDAGMTAVTCDNYGGGRLVADRLIAQGRRRIALIGGRSDTSTHLERSRGFRDRLDEAGLAPVDIRAGDYAYDRAFAAARDLVGDVRPDAVFCLNDVMALAAIDAARRAGMAVPDDLAVIGFDDIPMADWPSYRLTTVRQPLNRMCADALDMIETQRQDPGAASSIRVAPVRLILRDSG